MSTSRPLKIYLLPYFAQGHQLPAADLACLLASRGQHVTVITTPSNAHLFHHNHISLHILHFPSDELCLPAGLENLSDADDTTAAKIHRAAHRVQPQVESFIQQSPPDVFICDLMFTWSQASAKRLGIPTLIFFPLMVFTVCMTDAINANPESFESDSGPYNIPGLPHPITLPFKPSLTFATLTQSVVEAQRDNLGVIVNSFKELDVEYTEYYEKLTGRKVWHIGPTSLMVQKTVPSAAGDEHECLRWLSSKKNGSVVYICFGSLCRLSDQQLYEIALGLESSGHLFLWVVVRKNNGEEGEGEEGKWLPDGFEERMKEEDRGMLIKGWAPQPLILNHAAVGGFLTHCGWNATVEAISAGVPMITMPGFADQYYNEKLITEVHGFGVEVGAAEWSLSPYDAKKKVVSGERIEKAVKKLMDCGDEGERIKSKAEEMKEKAWKAVQGGGSSNECLTALVDHLQRLVVSN